MALVVVRAATAKKSGASDGGGAAAAPPLTTHWDDDELKIESEVIRSSDGAHEMYALEDPNAPSPPEKAALRAKIAAKLFLYASLRPPKGSATTGACTTEERRRFTDELLDRFTGGKKRKRPTTTCKDSSLWKKDVEEEEGCEKRNVVAYDQKSGALVATSGRAENPTRAATGMKVEGSSRLIVPRRRAPPKVPEPAWHPPWKLASVVSGHLGWVRCCAFEPGNEWFVTGSADRTIKVWDFAKCASGAEGGLKLTLTGHINAIRGLAVSPRTAYMFSAGEDKKVMCWDLEMNKVVRHYHGHLSGVYSLAIHPTLDLLMTGGRDSCCRVWDIRTSKQVMVLGGHNNTVGAIQCNSADPQVITGSHDQTVRLWDLAKGRTVTTLTHHKKAIRDLTVAKHEFSFVSGAADNIKKWQCKDGSFLRNMTGHNSIINTVDVNANGVLCSGGDDGTLKMWDYNTGYNFQSLQTVAQPGSLECEAGIYMARFDKSGSRLVTCEADKSIKIWKEDTEASEDSHPIDQKSWTKECRMLKRF